MKIKIEQIRNYIDTNTQIQREFNGTKIYSLFSNFNMMNIIDDEFSGKLVLYRLFDLDKDLTINGHCFNPRIRLANSGLENFNFLEKINGVGDDIYNAPYSMMQKLFEWHFWPFGDEYFDEGLLVDKMKL